MFYHIPKTAGRSVGQALTQVYYGISRKPSRASILRSGQSVSAVSEITGDDLDLLRERDLLMSLASPKNKLIAGHVPYSCYAYNHFHETTLFMSLLREPVSRFLSLFFFNRYKGSDHYSLECSLDQFIDSERGEQAGQSYQRTFGRDESGVIENADKRYLQALSNLKKLDIIGVVEEMSSFEEKMEDILRRKVQIPHINSNPRKKYHDDVTAEQMKKIQEICAQDTRLYEEARKL